MIDTLAEVNVGGAEVEVKNAIQVIEVLLVQRLIEVVLRFERFFIITKRLKI